MTYADIDLLEIINGKFVLIKHNNNEMFEETQEEKKHKNGDEVFKSSDGIVIAKDITIGPVKPKDVKVYKLYPVEQDDTLKKVVARFFKEFPSTRKYYTESQLINEVVGQNGLRKSVGSLAGIYNLTIPAYIPIEKKGLEQLEKLPAYQDHFVARDERTFSKIVRNEGYTKDLKEMEKLVRIMQEINGVQKPELFSTIKIPNVERYKLEKIIEEEKNE